MEDEQSTNVAEATPAEDPILSTLTDTEDESPAPVVEETVEEEAPEAEAEKTAEESPEEPEELQAEDDPKEIARKQYEERQRAREEREQRVRQQSEEYLQSADDEADQRLRAMEVREYNRTIEGVENTLISEFERVKANPDLQIFNPDNHEVFNERAYDKALRDYNAGYIQYDQNGNMVDVKGSLIEHLKETAELLQGAVKSGAVQQVRATNRMRSNADVRPAATPKESQKDPVLEVLLSD